MNVCELVGLLAELVRTSGFPCSENQQNMIAVLRAMPDYVQKRCLDKWEASFPWHRERDDLRTGKLLEGVFELGRCNLYTAFNEAETLREYATLAAKFLEAGLSPPQIDSIPAW